MKFLKIIPILILLVIGLSLYGLTVRGVDGNPDPKTIRGNLDSASQPFELSPERGRYLLLYSLVENKSFSLSKELATVAAPDVGVYKDKFYIFFAPGISLLAIPFYIIGKSHNISQVASFFFISVMATFNLVLIYLISKNILKIPAWASMAAALTFGFASTSWSYAITLYQHQVTTFFMLSIFYSVWKFRQEKSFSWIYPIYIWVAYATAIAIDYPNLLLLFPVMVYFAFSAFDFKKNLRGLSISVRTSAIVSMSIFIVLMGIQGYFNYTHFGSPLNVTNSLIGVNEIERQKKAAAKKVDTAEVKKLEENKTATGLLEEEVLPRGLIILLFAIDKGIFIFSPIFLLSILGIWKALKNYSLEVGVLLFTILMNLFVYGSFGDPWGGWAFGPRYLILSMSILSMFASYWVSGKKFSFFRKLLFLLLFVVSSAVALVGALTTNQVPPKIEADFLKMKYNFLLNLDYLKSGVTSSFAYKQFFTNIPLIYYYLYILESIIFVLFILLFIVPIFTHSKDEN